MARSNSISSARETLNHVSGLVEAFHAFDADNDGSINVEELGRIMSSLGYKPSKQEIEAMLKKGDSDEDGLLSISEFLALNVHDLELSCLKDIEDAFESLNFKDDDYLTGEILYQVIENVGTGLSLDDCVHVLEAMDRDGDGVVSFEDFKLILDALVEITTY